MLEGIKKLHFVGIGGVGMSAIAEVMLDKGYEISGSDLSESAVVKHLKAKGATIYKGHDALNVEGKEALVLSSAIHQDNPELVAAKAKGLKLKAKIEQDIADMKHLGLGAEIIQGTMQHVFNVKVGDKMPAVMNTEIIVEDEKIIEIRN